jgi:MFS transporter, UMF1 family
MTAVKREQTGWYFYDFANSAFASTVLTLLLGPYILELARAAAAPDGMIHPLGIPIDPRSWWSYMIALSVMLQVIVLPLAGAEADRSPNKRRLLGVWAYVGAAATLAMFFTHGDMYLVAGGLFLVANVAFGASVVVYNSFLPEIAGPEERDGVSSKGWALGYLGGGIALALNLLLFAKADAMGISQGMAARLNLASAGLWWAAFTIVPLFTLRNRPPKETGGGAREGFVQLVRTLRGLKSHPQMLIFLVAYLLFNDAVQAIIALAGQFGADELKIPMDTLALAILMVQFVAFLGALIFNWIARAMGTKRAILLSLVVWTGTLVAAYFSVKTTAQFFGMAAVIAIVLGGTQALSRSLFSQMVPEGREAEYFGIYEISDKGTSWMAPVFFALALQFTGSYRTAILSLIVFFIAGFAVLVRVDVRKAMEEAKRGS